MPGCYNRANAQSVVHSSSARVCAADGSASDGRWAGLRRRSTGLLPAHGCASLHHGRAGGRQLGPRISRPKRMLPLLPCDRGDSRACRSLERASTGHCLGRHACVCSWGAPGGIALESGTRTGARQTWSTGASELNDLPVWLREVSAVLGRSQRESPCWQLSQRGGRILQWIA
jgi:hypothetical protein